MIQTWKVPHIVKGMLTWLPIVDIWRLHHSSTGGSGSARYCYSVWLRHLVTLNLYGFRIKGAHIGELGPGDTIGIGLAALLSGAEGYVGLDVVPFSARAGLAKIFDELVEMYARREPIPDQNEFPRVRPILDSYEFPDHVIDWKDFTARVERIRTDLRKGMNNGQIVKYRAPWTSPKEIAGESLNLVLSQAAMQYVDALEQTYRAMFLWLKPGGYASHRIDFSAHHLSPSWNGHWAYSDEEWRLARGRREFFLNREPLSTHLTAAKKAGFELLLVKREHGSGGLQVSNLTKRFQNFNDEDLQTRGAILILRRPA